MQTRFAHHVRFDAFHVQDELHSPPSAPTKRIVVLDLDETLILFRDLITGAFADYEDKVVTLARAHSHTHTHTLTHSHTHTLTHTLTHTHSHSLTLTHTHSHIHTNTLTHTHTLKHT